MGFKLIFERNFSTNTGCQKRLTNASKQKYKIHPFNKLRFTYETIKQLF